MNQKGPEEGKKYRAWGETERIARQKKRVEDYNFLIQFSLFLCIIVLGVPAAFDPSPVLTASGGIIGISVLPGLVALLAFGGLAIFELFKAFSAYNKLRAEWDKKNNLSIADYIFYYLKAFSIITPGLFAFLFSLAIFGIYINSLAMFSLPNTNLFVALSNLAAFAPFGFIATLSWQALMSFLDLGIALYKGDNRLKASINFLINALTCISISLFLLAGTLGLSASGMFAFAITVAVIALIYKLSQTYWGQKVINRIHPFFRPTSNVESVAIELFEKYGDEYDHAKDTEENNNRKNRQLRAIESWGNKLDTYLVLFSLAFVIITLSLAALLGSISPVLLMISFAFLAIAEFNKIWSSLELLNAKWSANNFANSSNYQKIYVLYGLNFCITVLPSVIAGFLALACSLEHAALAFGSLGGFIGSIAAFASFATYGFPVALGLLMISSVAEAFKETNFNSISNAICMNFVFVFATVALLALPIVGWIVAGIFTLLAIVNKGYADFNKKTDAVLSIPSTIVAPGEPQIPQASPDKADVVGIRSDAAASRVENLTAGATTPNTAAIPAASLFAGNGTSALAASSNQEQPKLSEEDENEMLEAMRSEAPTN